MELTKQHREALLSELEKAETDLELQKHCLDKSDTQANIDLAGWFEIGHFLAQERVKLIKSAITNNEIDY